MSTKLSAVKRQNCGQCPTLCVCVCVCVSMWDRSGAVSAVCSGSREGAREREREGTMKHLTWTTGWYFLYGARGKNCCRFIVMQAVSTHRRPVGHLLSAHRSSLSLPLSLVSLIMIMLNDHCGSQRPHDPQKEMRSCSDRLETFICVT
jgi:hypothetical protein